MASITPILRLPGVLETLQSRRGPTVAVAPVVTGQAPASGPERGRAIVRAALLQSLGIPHRAAEVASLYRSFLDGFVLDERDGDQAAEIEAMGIRVLVADTLAQPDSRPGLAAAVLRFSAGGAAAAVPPRSPRPARERLPVS
jgi:2-phospho-L-lactate transferase/gluconeogenesis factor (CofD/UPF0052 family)